MKLTLGEAWHSRSFSECGPCTSVDWIALMPNGLFFWSGYGFGPRIFITETYLKESQFDWHTAKECTHA